MEPNQYEIETFSQLMNVVNDENIDRIGTDFLIWLKVTNDTFNTFRKMHPDLKDAKNSDIAKASFIWIDDNKHEVSGIQLKDYETGKISIIKP